MKWGVCGGPGASAPSLRCFEFILTEEADLHLKVKVGGLRRKVSKKLLSGGTPETSGGKKKRDIAARGPGPFLCSVVPGLFTMWVPFMHLPMPSLLTGLPPQEPTVNALYL